MRLIFANRATSLRPSRKSLRRKNRHIGLGDSDGAMIRKCCGRDARLKKFTLEKRLLSYLPPKLNLSIQYFLKLGKWPNLTTPKTFNEKVQYRKLYDRNILLGPYADKYLVKDYVAAKIGAEHVIPTLWSGKTLPALEERNWPKPFVLKANHMSGTNIFIWEDDEPDWPVIERSAAQWMASRYRPHLLETHYDLIDRQLLVEPLIGHGEPLQDYKFHVFNGKVEFILMYTGRGRDLRAQMLNRDWQPMDCRYYRDVPDDFPERPASLQKMIEISESLASDFCFARVDLYEFQETPLFGEVTFMPGSGFCPFEPEIYDHRFGAMWDVGKMRAG